MNGFDMLEQFENLFFDVVFCTAYDQFAIKAFRYSALNYLLKPVDPEDLKQTVQRIEQKKNPPVRIVVTANENAVEIYTTAHCINYWRWVDICTYCRYYLL